MWIGDLERGGGRLKEDRIRLSVRQKEKLFLPEY
jgi:hypothetical protein